MAREWKKEAEKDEEVVVVVEEEEEVKEVKREKRETTTEYKHSYPYPNRCSMWSTQPPPARIPRWVTQYNQSCQRYLYVPFNPDGGFGHKTDNFMNGGSLSSALNYTYAMTYNLA